MKKIHRAVCLLLILLANSAFSLCDLTRFRWECELPIHKKPSSGHHSLVYCGDTPLYLSTSQYMELVRYQRANINMVLKVNDEYLEAPCIPAERYFDHPRNRSPRNR